MESKCVLGAGEMITAIPDKTQDILRETGRLDYILRLISSPNQCHFGDSGICTCEAETLKFYTAFQFVCIILLKQAISFNSLSVQYLDSENRTKSLRDFLIWLAAESLVKDQAKLGPNIGESWSVSNV